MATTKDWPQACYNEVSMWVTAACKEYIETVYYPTLTTTTVTTTDTTATVEQPPITDTVFLAGPAPVFGTGIIPSLFIAIFAYGLLKWRKRVFSG